MRVSTGVSAAMITVAPSSSVSAKVTILSSVSWALSLLSVRVMCGTSTALKTPPETSVKITCGIIEPAW